MNPKKVALAYSGGLDTSFCIPFIKKTYQADVIAVNVDCTGLEESQKNALKDRALLLGATEFYLIDATNELYTDVISYLIKGNVLRDRTYPLCVGAERFIQAKKVAELAFELGCDTVAHGSTGAGNDQIRFDAAIRALAPQVNILTPIREHGFQREFMANELAQDFGLDFAKSSVYSINEGIWGVTVGGGNTVRGGDTLPFEAYPHMPAPHELNDQPETVSITFQHGLPIAINDTTFDTTFDLLHQIKLIGEKHGIGRGIHTGDTILGFKGRIGFEAPVATILYAAHRELEKVILSKHERLLKDQLADQLGILWHEALYFDPAVKAIQAFLDQTQQRVHGTVTLYLYRGNIYPTSIQSTNSTLNRGSYQYGEQSQLWSGNEAAAFSKIIGISTQQYQSQA